MEFKNWLTKNIALASIIAAALLILIVFLGVDVARRSRSISEKRQDLTTRLDAIRSLASLKIDAERAGELTNELESMLPAKDQLIAFSKELENIAKRNRLSFGFSFEEEITTKEMEPGINGFTLTLEGSYSNFLNFFNGI